MDMVGGMKPGRLKALGTAMLLLALVGSLSSFSAVLAGGDGLAFLVVNLILFVAGLLTLRLGYRRARNEDLGQS